MRIVYLHQYFHTPDMAGGVRSYEMARRIVAAGHEVHMVTTDQRPGTPDAPDWRESVEAGINVHWASVPYSNEMAYAARIRAFLRFAWLAASRATALKPDLIFATSTPLTIALPAIFASRRLRRPMVFEVRDLWPAVPIAIGALQNPVLKRASIWLERLAYRNSSWIVALAPGMKQEIAATGFPAERISVIPNGCDLELHERDTEGPALRARHAWLDTRRVITFCGTFGLVNGMDYLPRLARSLLDVDPEIRLVGIGGGRELEPTRRLAMQLGVLERNLFLLGPLPKRDTAAWLAASDMTLALFTGPSIVWRDAVQNKFFDSLAAGKPVANNFSGWQAHIAVENGAGLILSAADTDVAARDLARALNDASWLTAAKAAARGLAHARFDRDILAAQLLEVLTRVGTGTGPAPCAA